MATSASNGLKLAGLSIFTKLSIPSLSFLLPARPSTHENDDMEDLTAQLESALENYTPGRDSLDLGGGDDFVPGQGLDRYRVLDDGTDDDPYAKLGPGIATTYHHSNDLDGVTSADALVDIGPLGGMSVAPAPPPPISNAEAATAAFASYGQIMPPSYEDSVMYDSVHVDSGPASSAPGGSGGDEGSSSGAAGAAHSTPPPKGAGPSRLSAPAAAARDSFDQPCPSPSVPSIRGTRSPLHITVQDPIKRESTGFLGITGTRAPLHIPVQDPIKRESTGFLDITGGYVTYQISTRTQLPGFKPQATVRRRFNDFVALSELVKFRFRGYFVPPRPEKNAVEGQRMTDDFVEERRCALQQYLGKLALHPKIATSEELRVFLETEGELSENPAWRTLVPIPQGSLIDGTAKLSMQLFGFENRGTLIDGMAELSMQLFGFENRVLDPQGTGPVQGSLIEGTAKLSMQLFGFENRVLDPVQAVRPAKSTADPLHAMKEKAQSMQQQLALALSGEEMKHLTNHSPARPPTRLTNQPPTQPPLLQAVRPAKSTADPLRAMKEKAQSMQQQPALALSGEELEMRRAKEHLEATRTRLLTASRAAEKLVHRMERGSSVQGDLGLSLFKLAKLEEVDGAHLAQYTGTAKISLMMSTELKSVGTSLVRVSRITRKATGRSATQLAALHEYLAFMPATIKGMMHREKQLLTFHTLQADLEAKQRGIRDLEAAGGASGSDKNKAKKMQDLQNDGAKLEMSIEAANAEYERLKGINKQELTRFRSELDLELCDMLIRFSALQASANELVLEVWMQQALHMGAKPEEIAALRPASWNQAGPSNGKHRQ
eukprot:gene21064-27943_t